MPAVPPWPAPHPDTGRHHANSRPASIARAPSNDRATCGTQRPIAHGSRRAGTEATIRRRVTSHDATAAGGKCARHHRRQRTLRSSRTRQSLSGNRSPRRSACRAAILPVVESRDGRRLSASPRRGPPPHAVGAAVPGQRLRPESARRHAPAERQRRRQPAGGPAAAVGRSAGPDHRPHLAAAADLLRRWRGRPRRSRRSVLPAPAQRHCRRGRRDRAGGDRRRHATSASRDRSSRPRPNRTSTGRGVRRSSA